MNIPLESSRNGTADQPPVPCGRDDRQSVLQELDRILASRHFMSADRSKQFLRYVVLNMLDGHTERLKERTIGTEVFQRPPGYATGEDSVVRVLAGEVRHRLERYYQETLKPNQLRIELPVGSYCPVLNWGDSQAPQKPDPLHDRQSTPRRLVWMSVLLVALGLIVAMLVVFRNRLPIQSVPHAVAQKSMVEQFWGPAFASHQPILICLANARRNPSEERSQISGKNRSIVPPSETDEDASHSVDPDEKVKDGTSAIYPDLVPESDAAAAVVLSGLFGKMNKPSQLRVGAAATYVDLRNFPSVIIGGFDSRWTMQLVSNLRYTFVWDQGMYMIREQVPGGRGWTTRFGPKGETAEDFALVSRLIESKTGQFTVTVAGIGPRGTEAAGAFVSSERYLEEGLANAPADWQNRNFEVLLQTTVTDSVAGPPHVVAMYSW